MAHVAEAVGASRISPAEKVASRSCALRDVAPRPDPPQRLGPGAPASDDRPDCTLIGGHASALGLIPESLGRG